MQKLYRVRKREHSELLYDLLHARGITKPQAQEDFLEPSFERDSHDPFLLPDMAAAVARIQKALAEGEQVAVWSDYDCDGIPGGVMLTEFLRTIGLSVVHYIPHRNREGFGLNAGGIDELKEKSVSLIVTVDLGTSEAEQIAYAKEKGIDTIVTDHHLPSAELPPAVAVINPKRADSQYPFKELCGAGVAWKLVQAILSKNRPESFAEGREKWLLDLVGLGTLSDMVPLVGENRMLAHYGLVVMRRARRPGLAALLKLLRITPRTLTEDDIGFMVAPRINAASRMDNPERAAALLAASGEEAQALARELNSLNDERKTLVATVVREANSRLKVGDALESPVIVLGSPKWRPGILGLVANSLVEAHGKPVFLWGRDGGEAIRGSVRLPRHQSGSRSVSVVELMGATQGAFVEFGGHHASGGFEVALEKVHELRPRLTSAYEALAEGPARASEVVVERELALSELPFALRDLARLAPFGVGNEKPLFVFPNISVTGLRTFGKHDAHLEAHVSDGFEQPVSAVSFFSTPDSFSKPLAQGRADIVGHVERDWRGRARIRMVDVI